MHVTQPRSDDKVPAHKVRLTPMRSLAVKVIAIAGVVLSAWLIRQALRLKPTPLRHHVSGAVTLEGQPLQDGLIAFEPYGSNQVGGGHAIIANGEYDTQSTGRGHLGGPHLVRIEGFSSAAPATENADAGLLSLFPSFETDIVLPRKASVINFDVPKRPD